MAVALVLPGCAGRPLITLVAHDYVEARDAADVDLRSDPTDMRALRVLGWNALMLGDHEEARQAFLRLEQLEPKSFDAKLGLARVLIATGELDQAQQALERAEPLAGDWNRSSVDEARGRLALARGDWSEASRLFERAGGDGLESWGRVALAQDDLEEAERRFRQGLSRDLRCHRCLEGLARVALARGDVKGALEHAVDGARRARHDYGLVELIDDLLRRLGDDATSEETHIALVAAYPNDALYHARLGHVVLSRGRIEEARSLFTRALALDPGHVAATRGLVAIILKRRARVMDAWAAHGAGRHADALAAFEARVEEAREAGDPTVEEGLGWTLLAMDRPDEALAAFDAALAIAPDLGSAKAGAMLARRQGMPEVVEGWAALARGDLTGAAALFRRLPARHGDLGAALADEGLGWEAYYAHQRDEAASFLTAARGRSREAFRASWGMGLLSLDREDWWAAEYYLLDSVEIQPYQEVSLYSGAAEALLVAGQPEPARRLLLIGEQAHPFRAEIQIALARVQLALGQRREAMARARLAVQLSPVVAHEGFNRTGLDPRDLLDSCLDMAWGLYFAGDLDAALVRFEQYLAVGGSNPNARRGRGFTLHRLGRHQDAIPDLTEAALHEPDPLRPVTESMPIPGTGESRAVVYNASTMLAWARLRLGQAAEAEVLFRHALGTNPDWLDARTGLGFALLEQGKAPEAIQAFEEVLRSSPADPDALRGRAMAGP